MKNADTEAFAEGVAYVLQRLRDLEIEAGHVHLDGLAANHLSSQMRNFAVTFSCGDFEVVKRTAPYSETYEAIKS